MDIESNIPTLRLVRGLSHFDIDEDPALDRTLFNNISVPDVPSILAKDKKLKDKIAHLGNVNDELLKKIAAAAERVKVTDTTGNNFVPGEEADIVPPQWTSKGSHCSSTKYIRAQIIRHAQFKILYQQKQEELKVPNPNAADFDEILVEIDALCEHVLDDRNEHLFKLAKDCDKIRELLGPTDVTPRWFQRILLNEIHVKTLVTKRKALETKLAKLEYCFQRNLFVFYEQTLENMKNFIEGLPKFHPKKLYCRNSSCRDCKHPCRPTLSYHGLNEKAKRKKSQGTHEMSPKKRELTPTPRQRSAEPHQRSPEPRQRSSEQHQRSPERRYESPEPRQRSPERRYESPEPRWRSPEQYLRSPEPRWRSPEQYLRSPEPRRRSPEPRWRSPEPRWRSPEPCWKSPETNRRSPEPSWRPYEQQQETYDRDDLPQHCDLRNDLERIRYDQENSGYWDYSEPTQARRKYRRMK